jgi:predicted DNA-binding transcriptional regulator AlpA
VEREDIRLMGPQEIQHRLGLSRQWTAQIIQRKGFPEPIAVLAIGSVWLADDVEDWITENRPKVDEAE